MIKAYITLGLMSVLTGCASLPATYQPVKAVNKVDLVPYYLLKGCELSEVNVDSYGNVIKSYLITLRDFKLCRDNYQKLLKYVK